MVPASFILWSNVGRGGAKGHGTPPASSPTRLVGEGLQEATVLAKTDSGPSKSGRRESGTAQPLSVAQQRQTPSRKLPFSFNMEPELPRPSPKVSFFLLKEALDTALLQRAKGWLVTGQQLPWTVLPHSLASQAEPGGSTQRQPLFYSRTFLLQGWGPLLSLPPPPLFKGILWGNHCQKDLVTKEVFIGAKLGKGIMRDDCSGRESITEDPSPKFT